MQHSQSDVALGTKHGSWAELKAAVGLKKRSNTAQNLQFYGAHHRHHSACRLCGM